MFTFILALFGISFLIFIHEIGHYWMARLVGMRVEIFAIGFGRPILSWMRRGVKWQVGWLPFGGFVKIAGTDTSGDGDPYAIPDGFFGKRPIDRIKVALAGPLVNILFAFFVFALLWGIGGREKSAGELTRRIGWVDPQSALYAEGIRPGDEVIAYGDVLFRNYKDHFFAPMTAAGPLTIEGVHYRNHQEIPFRINAQPYTHPALLEGELKTVGILQPASYLIYDRLPSGEENPLPKGSPMLGSGLQYGDRLLWVDGHLIFSEAELSHLINDERVLLTIRRGDRLLLRRVPRVEVRDLKPDREFREELIDWQYAAELGQRRAGGLLTIPYNLTGQAVVEGKLSFIDRESERAAFPNVPFSQLEEPLQEGDRIIAVQGQPVNFSYQLLRELQQKRVHLIVQRGQAFQKNMSWQDADEQFLKGVDEGAIQKIAGSIGTGATVRKSDGLYLLKPIIPKKLGAFLRAEEQSGLKERLLERRRGIESIEDSKKRNQFLDRLEKEENLLILGISQLQDRKVLYNPQPTELFEEVTSEIWRTLKALVSGALSPRYVAGPVGIIQIVQETTRVSLKEALFWIGAISLNLGLLNLLPIPVLDGGSILFSLFEWVSGRRIPPKTLEKLIIPFAILLIAFFLFLTYHDISRLITAFFN